VSRVVLLTHDGVSCALPASQVIGAAARSDAVATLPLFGRDVSASEPRSVLARTPFGERWISCSEARFDWLSPDGIFPVPELLRDVMGLPHVVGLAERAGDVWVWLVDLDRLVVAPVDASS